MHAKLSTRTAFKMCCSRADGSSSVIQNSKASATAAAAASSSQKRTVATELDYDYIREYCEKLSGHVEIVWVLCE